MSRCGQSNEREASGTVAEEQGQQERREEFYRTLYHTVVGEEAGNILMDKRRLAAMVHAYAAIEAMERTRRERADSAGGTGYHPCSHSVAWEQRSRSYAPVTWVESETEYPRLVEALSALPFDPLDRWTIL